MTLYNTSSRPLIACLAIALLEAGCASPIVDPPHLDLNTWPGNAGISTSNPLHVTVKNGAGETLFDQDVKAGVGSSANPPLDKLDGKLIITTRWDIGTVTNQELTYVAGKRVDIGWNGHDYYLKIPPISAEVALGRASTKVGQPSIGVRNPLGAETPLHKAPGRVDATRLDFAFPIRRLGPYDARLGFRFQSGDESNRGRVEIGDGTSGVSYFEPPPGSASTGLNYGGTGGESTFKSEFDSQEVHLNLFKTLKDTGNSDIWLEKRIAIQRAVAQFKGRVQNLTYSDIHSDHDLKVKTNGISDGIGVRGRHAFPNGLRLGGGIGAELKAFWTDYNGSQLNTCGVCAGSEADFTARASDSKNRLTWGAWLDGDVSYPVGKSGELFLRAEYTYQHDSPVLITPVSPGGPNRLATDNADSYGYQVGVRFSF